MCGIHFIQSVYPEAVQLLNKFIENSNHRGPDANGAYFDKIGDWHYGIGHNLLSIVGQVAQPILKQNHFLTFNGEIYNYKSLAKEYGITHFQNDTDVLYSLLSQFGVKIIPELEGMFAFVFVDTETKTTILARDFFGQKPLYYYNSKELFAASSESNNLRSFFQSKISTAEVKHLLNFKHSSKSNSIYQNIQTVDAGHYIELSLNGKMIVKSFQIKEKETKSNLQEAIKKSVLEQCGESSNPAVLFSGGLDSSIILYELKKLGKNPIAYTIATDIHNKFATHDVEFAKKICEKFDIEHRLIVPQKEDFDEFIQFTDQPVGDGAFFLQYVITKEIAKESRFALTGAGADELFGGYRRYWALDKFIKNKKVVLKLKKHKNLVSYLLKDPKKTLVKRTLESVDLDHKQSFVNFTKLNFGLRTETIHSKPFDLSSALNYDVHNFLCQDVLSIADQSGMANGVELRSPFLSQEIYNLSNSLNASEKILNGGKFHLKEIYKEPLSEIVSRKKEGFGLPFISFWGDAYKNELLNLSQELISFISEDERTKIITTINKWNDSYSNEYWTLLILCKWLKINQYK